MKVMKKVVLLSSLVLVPSVVEGVQFMPKPMVVDVLDHKDDTVVEYDECCDISSDDSSSSKGSELTEASFSDKGGKVKVEDTDTMQVFVVALCEHARWESCRYSFHFEDCFLEKERAEECALTLSIDMEERGTFEVAEATLSFRNSVPQEISYSENFLRAARPSMWEDTCKIYNKALSNKVAEEPYNKPKEFGLKKKITTWVNQNHLGFI